MPQHDQPQMLPIGTLLHGGTYRVVRYIASGGFGHTYEVEHQMLHKRYCMKEFFLRGSCLRSGTLVTVSTEESRVTFEQMRAKFFREAQRMARIEHPNIVEVTDCFEENQTAYYVMKLIDGQSLAKRLADRGRPYTEAEVTAMLPQLLGALRCVHGQQLYHLDLKPANIMAGTDGHLWLIDFGASKQTSRTEGLSVSSSTGFLLTLGYAPAEQVNGSTKRIGPWTDLYALGATLYNLLTCQQPPDVDDVRYEGEHAFHFPASLSPRLRSLILWLMRPDYPQRPQSVEEVEQWLSQPATSTFEPEAKPEPIPVPEPKPEPESKLPPAPKPASRPTSAHNSMAGQETVRPAAGQATVKRTEKQATVKHAEPVVKASQPEWSTGVLVVFIAEIAALLVLLVFAMSRCNGNRVEDDGPVEAPEEAVSEKDMLEEETVPDEEAVSEEETMREEEAVSDEEAVFEERFSSCPDTNHPHAIYLGLPSGTKWACCNVGATSPTDYGEYYAWGETETKKSFSWRTYQYGASQDNVQDIGSNIAGTQYDVAHTRWGGSWQMPSKGQIAELYYYTDSGWTTINGVVGRKFTSKTNVNWVFFPAAGFWEGNALRQSLEGGFYWASSIYPSTHLEYACDLYVGSSIVHRGIGFRCYGQCIRPVQ